MVKTVGEMLEALGAWLQLSLAGAKVEIVGPGTALGDGISMMIVGVAPNDREPGSGERRTLDVSILLVARHSEPTQAATLAGELAFILAQGFWSDPEGERRQLAVEPGAAEACRALGLGFQLVILIKTPFARRLEQRETKPVLAPLAVEIGEIGQLDGIVLGEKTGLAPRPLPDAVVSAPAFGRSTASDQEGRFRLTGLPPQGPIGLRVNAKGRSLELQVSNRKSVTLTIPM